MSLDSIHKVLQTTFREAFVVVVFKPLFCDLIMHLLSKKFPPEKWNAGFKMEGLIFLISFIYAQKN